MRNVYIYRLYEQGVRQEGIHFSIEPVRDVREAVSYKTMERSSKVPKAGIRIYTRLLESVEYIPIDVNMYMDGLDTMAKYNHIHLSIFFSFIFFILINLSIYLIADAGMLTWLMHDYRPHFSCGVG